MELGGRYNTPEFQEVGLETFETWGLFIDFTTQFQAHDTIPPSLVRYVLVQRGELILLDSSLDSNRLIGTPLTKTDARTLHAFADLGVFFHGLGSCIER